MITTLEPDDASAVARGGPTTSSPSPNVVRRTFSTPVTESQLKRRPTSQSLQGIPPTSSSCGAPGGSNNPPNRPPDDDGPPDRGRGNGDEPKSSASNDSGARIKAVGDEQPLPSTVEVPPRLLGRPLQEVDPYLLEPVRNMTTHHPFTSFNYLVARKCSWKGAPLSRLLSK